MICIVVKPAMLFIWLQGLGLFAARDLEKHTMVIEYIGQLIRNEVAEMREKIYEKQVSTDLQLALANVHRSSFVMQLCVWFLKLKWLSRD